MRVTVVEAEGYTQRSEELLSPDEREGVRSFLAEYPEGGDVIPDLAGAAEAEMDAAEPEQREARRNQAGSF